MERRPNYKFNSNENMSTPEKLTKSIFCIYLGGKHPRANIEMHDLVVTTGNKIEDCFQFCRDNWFANEKGSSTMIKPHIDGYFQIELSDSYVNNGEFRLYLMNYGGYLKGQLAEMHEFVTVFALNKGDAIKRSNKNLQLGLKLLHMDNCLEVDDCLDITTATGLKFPSLNNSNVTITMHQEYFSI